MPWGDRTGPIGLGPRSGRGLGYCAGFNVPGYAHPGFGGFGRGAGWRHGFYAAPPAGWGYPPYTPPTRENTLSDLKAYAEWLKGQLDAVNKRIEELEE